MRSTSSYGLSIVAKSRLWTWLNRLAARAVMSLVVCLCRRIRWVIDTDWMIRWRPY